MGEKISQLIPAASLDGSELIETVQGGNSRRTTTQDIANLGSGVTIYTGDGVLTGDRTLYLDGKFIKFKNGDDDFFSITPGEDIVMRMGYSDRSKAIEFDDDGGGVYLYTESKFVIQKDGEPHWFLVNIATGEIQLGKDDATYLTIVDNLYNFAGGDVIISSFAGGGTTGLSIDNDGKIIRGGGVPDTAYASNADAVVALGVGKLYKSSTLTIADSPQILITV